MADKAIIFDLDGTLTDSGEGIINCAEMTLRYFGLPVPNRETMGVFVGPPLRDTFISFGVPKERIEESIEVFRSRYNTVGKFENYPYPGVPELLKKLNEDGYILAVATSKPEATACEILRKFELTDYFQLVCGASLDGSADAKELIIARVLNHLGDTDHLMMVGDTVFDVLGAAVHKIPTIGVSWGYGNTEDMIEAGAISIANDPDELYKMICKKVRAVP